MLDDLTSMLLDLDFSGWENSSGESCEPLLSTAKDSFFSLILTFKKINEK